MPEISDEALAELEAKAATADTLQTQLTQQQADAQAAETAAQDAQASVTEAREAVATATAVTREALIAANPAIPADLIKGDNIDALKESVATATAIATRLADAAAAQGKGALGFLLGGGGTRLPANTEGMTPLQKVVHGIQHEADQHLA